MLAARWWEVESAAADELERMEVFMMQPLRTHSAVWSAVLLSLAATGCCSTFERDWQAALTGHLVLSTVHTNDAPSTINRMLNMGIEPFLIASSVNLIMAQRLARVVCPKCREPHEVPAQAMVELGVPEDVAKAITAYRGPGCQHCGGTGFRGRTALYEMMAMTDPLRELILSGASAIELKRQAISDGMKTLRQSGIEKVADGVTSIEEVMRVTMND